MLVERTLPRHTVIIYLGVELTLCNETLVAVDDAAWRRLTEPTPQRRKTDHLPIPDSPQ
jgi:hypothetical protein